MEKQESNLTVGVHYLGKSNVMGFDWTGTKSLEYLSSMHFDRGVKLFYESQCGCAELVVYDDNMNAVQIYRGEDINKVDEFDMDYFITHHKVDVNSKPFSKRFGIGTYWDDSDKATLVDDETIERSLQYAKNVERAKQERRERQELADKLESENIRKEYGSYLTETANHYDNKTTANNLRIVLKRNFPTTKFRVYKGSGYDSYYVTWVDGPTKAEVEKATGMFNTKFVGDPMTDYYAYSDTNFTSIYGGFDYLWYERSISDEKLKELELEVNKAIEDDKNHDIESVFYHYRAKFNETSMNFEPKIEDICRMIAKYTNFVPQVAEEVDKVASKAVNGTLELIDYSDKAIALIGDTKAIKEQLKALGGRFNPRLSCGAGWIFSKKKESELKATLNL
jgi:hypothetical protein